LYAATGDLLIRQPASETVLGQAAVQVNQADRSLANEIQVLQSDEVQKAAEDDLHREAKISAKAVTSADVIRLRATAHVPDEAADTVNTFAKVYIEYRATAIVDDLSRAQAAVQTKRDQVQKALDEVRQPVLALDSQLQALGPDASPSTRVGLQRQRDDQAALIASRERSLENQLANYDAQLDDLQVSQSISTGGGPRLINPAVASSAPVSPKPLRNALLALVLGLLLGLAIAFLRDFLDDSLRDKDDLERVTRLTTLGLVPALPGWRDKNEHHVASIENPSSPAAEAYRSLRTSLQFTSLDGQARIIQLTSPSQSEGKTTTLANLGVALAQAGQTVCLVCCDLRRPRLNRFFDLPNRVGFTSVLLRETGLGQAVHSVPSQPRLHVLTSGPIPPNPSELLSLPSVRALFDELLERFDVVLIDSPPVLPVTDAMVLSGVAHSTILVASASQTTKRRAHRAMELLVQVKAPLVGTVLNGVSSGDGNYGYQYDSYYRSETAK
jgi:capsular exopolysaccharide synthesis family protein